MEARFVDIHTHRDTEKEEVLAIQNMLAGEVNLNLLSGKQFFSLGFHPWEIKMGQSATHMFEGIKQFLFAPDVLIIGETGLDRTIKAPIDLQQELFELHVEASEKIQKPLLIHCVRAFPELMAIKKGLKPKMPWIVHGYRSNTQVLEQLIQKGIYISFGPGLLNDEEKFRELLQLVPDEFLFFETDDSDIEIEVIYERAASLMNTDLPELKAIVFRNAQLLLPK